MTPRRRSAWHAKLPPYAMIAWRNVSAWMEVGSEWCLHKRCVLLEFHLSFMRPATVLSLKFLYARPLCFFCTCLEEQSQVSTGKFLLTNSLCSTHKTRCNTNMQVPLSSPHLHLSALLPLQKRQSIPKDSLLQKAISVCGEMVRVRAKFRYTSASGKASKIASAIPCARPSYTPYFWRQVDISPHEILYFRHFRLHKTQLFDSGSRAQGVGWDEIIFVGLETMCDTMILSAHMLDASSQEWIGFLCLFPPNLENKLQGALNERLLKYCVQLYVEIGS